MNLSIERPSLFQRNDGTTAPTCTRAAMLSLCLLLGASACSADQKPATTGHGGTGGAAGIGGASGGSSGGAGSGGVTGAGGVAGTGGTGGTAGTAGAGGAAGGGGTTGAGGSDGGAADGGQTEGGAGGSGPCSPGHAISFSTNGAGTGTSGANSDAAAARVVVDFAASSDLPIGNDQRTIEFWAYVLSSSWVGNANTMFFYGGTQRPTNGAAHGFGLDFGTFAVMGMPSNHATLDPFTNGGFDADSTNDIGLTSSKDQWAHFAMTWDGTVVRTFVNGVEKITKMGDSGVTMLNTDRSSIAIGGYEQDGNYFNGAIDEFRVWKVARSAAEITATMKKTLVGNETGLVAYLKFDETAGPAADSVTTPGHTAHNGMLMSANGKPPTFIVSTAPTCP